MLPKPVTPGAAAAAYWGRWFVCTLLHGLLVMLLLAAGTATAAPTTPTEDFTDNGDGTVTHRVTGLTWMRCAMGMTWTGTDCTGTANTYTWEQATALTANFAGKSDWRLPSIAELNTIVEREAVFPAINSVVFPNSPFSGFWSGSPMVASSFFAWNVDFGDGYSLYGTGSLGPHLPVASHAVRLMRKEGAFDPLAPSTPNIDFFDNGDGTVTHIKTGLMWKRCAEGQNWNGITCYGIASSYSWDTAVAITSSSAGHSDWRIPTENELLTIVEHRAYMPAINTAIFPNTPNNSFWSSLHAPWAVSFVDGSASKMSPSTGGAIRLVRQGQFFGHWGFLAKTDANPATVLTSNAAIIAPGSEPVLTVLIDGGSYAINGGPYTANPGTIGTNDSVTVRLTASTAFATTTRATLTVGGIVGYFSVTTLGAPDSQPPSVSTNLTAVASSDGNISVAWDAAIDNVGVTSYMLFRDGIFRTRLGAVTRFVDTGLSPATRYSYSLAACDAANNCSALSQAVTATTMPVASVVAGPTTPTEDFFDNGDGTVTHRLTGLTWMRCAMGTSWTGTTCTSDYSIYTWDEARHLTFSFAGKSDWRLPSMAELQTIVERTANPPAVNSVVFPNTPNWTFWSASTRAYASADAWKLASDGNTDFIIGGGKYAVRLVRSEQFVNTSAPSTPTSDFVDNGDGTVTHVKTGLMWKRCAEGQAWVGTDCSYLSLESHFDWNAAATLTSNAAGHSDWRIPTAAELLTIVEYATYNPAINTVIFPGTPSASFWSGSASAMFPDNSAMVHFYDGNVYTSSARSNFGAVRLVRSGQFFSPLGFTAKAGATPSTPVTSNALKVYGSGGAITVTGGQYAINDGPYTSAPGTVRGNDSVTVRVTSAPTPGTATRATLTIGSVSGHFVVTTATDVLAPLTPASLTTTAGASLSGTPQMHLIWAVGTDNTALTHYRIYRNGALLAVVDANTTQYTDTALANGAQFTYAVQACDAAGNCSNPSSAATYTLSQPATIAARLAVGAGHSGAIRSDGVLLTWGLNEAGQLGLGNTGANRSAPQTIADAYTALAAGGSHSLAVKTDASLWAWGANVRGQLGDGSTTPRHVPVQVGTGYTAVAAGDSHSLGLKSDSSLWAWGNNGTGQLGDGTNNASATPILVGTGFYAVAAGASHTVAIKLDGTLWAWGSNNFGQLGDGTGHDRYAPRLIGHGFAAVAAGASHTLAIKTDGTLWAWGRNDAGQLGDNTLQNRYAPVQVGSGYSVTAGTLAAGYTHSLALKADGTLWAWGANDSGQLGSANYVGARSPQRLAGATDVTAIAAGGHTSLALKRDGSVLSWGANNTGQLGDGTLGERSAPVLVVSPGVDGYLNLTASATAAVAANLRVPFFVSVSGAINAQTATVRSTTRFAQTDLGQSGAVFVVARVPVDALGAVLGSNTSAPVARTPRAAGESTSVLVQLTASGWRAVVNGQLIPYASGVLGEQTAAQNILDNTDTSTMAGAEFCVGYGRSADEMVGAGRMRVVATIPGLSAAGVTSASCLMGASTGSNHSALAADADAIFGWAERTYPQYFSPANQGSQSVSAHRYRAYNDGHYLAVNESGEAHLYYLGPLSAQVFLDLGLLVQWLTTAGL